jgi:hydrogenase/urease accessory protein HupE
MKHHRGLKLLLTLAVMLAWAPPASAHLMNTGLGPFYDGLAHPFVTPEDLLPVIGLTLLASLRGPRYGRTVLFVLPAAWLAGTLAGRLLGPHTTVPAATAVLTIALGALAAADRSLNLTAVTALAVVLGLVNGAFNGMELAAARAGVLPAAGAACALFVLVALLAGSLTGLRAPWSRIVLRVAGSWIAASGLFMLGWSLRGA